MAFALLLILPESNCRGPSRGSGVTGLLRISHFDGWLGFYLIFRAIWRGQRELSCDGI